MPPELELRFEAHRTELRAYCYRMLASPFDAEDAVQDTFIRAWRAYDRFEGRSSLRSWLYKIATNVCLDTLRSAERRARPMDLGPAGEPVAAGLRELPETTWLEPAPDELVIAPGGDPAERAVARDSVRLAFVAALQQLPSRQRAALILCEVLQWKATEVAELLETSVASVNSALQRARTTLAATGRTSSDMKTPTDMSAADRDLLARYVAAFEAYDIEALTAVIHEDAIQSMPPYDLWLSGRDDMFAWWFGPGIGCKGSRSDRPAFCHRTNGFPGRVRPARGRRPTVASNRGLCRWSSFVRAASAKSPPFWAPPRCSRCSGRAATL